MKRPNNVSLSNSKKYVCAARGDSMDNNVGEVVQDSIPERRLLESLEKSIEDRGKNCATRTLLDTKIDKEEKNSSFVETSEKRGENSVSNTVVSDRSVLDTKNGESQKMVIQEKEAEDKPELSKMWQERLPNLKVGSKREEETLRPILLLQTL